MSCSYYGASRLTVLKTAAIGWTEVSLAASTPDMHSVLENIAFRLQALPQPEPAPEILKPIHYGPQPRKRGKGKQRREWDC